MPTSPRTPTSLVLEKANDQNGVISRRQILDLGVSDGFITSAISSQHLCPIYPGVYAFGHAHLTAHGHWMAAVLAGGGTSALSHRSAAANWGLTQPPDRIDILRSSSPAVPRMGFLDRPSEFGRRLVVRRSRWFGPEEFGFPNGIRTTTVARTFLDLASTWSTRQLNSALTEAERRGIIEFDRLREVTRRGRGWRGVGRLREVVEAWDPRFLRTRSELEIEFLDLCRRQAIPAPEINVLVGGFEVDCLWPDHHLIVELDGYHYHRAPDAFDRDKERTAALEDLGFQVLRLTYRMVTEEQLKTARRVKSRLEKASGSN